MMIKNRTIKYSFPMCKKIFLLGVYIVGVFLNAYPQNKGGGLESKTIMKEKPKIKVIPGIGLNVSTTPVPYMMR